jgi:hypothetical protein
MDGDVIRIGPFWWVAHVYDSENEMVDYQICLTRGLAKRWLKNRLENSND